MISFFYIAAAGPEAVFWVIVAVIAIISHIVKASKKASQPVEEKQNPLGDSTGAEAELQKFLETLTGAPKPPPPPPAPPTTQAQRIASRRTATMYRKTPTPTVPKPPPPPAPLPMPVQETAGLADAYAVQAENKQVTYKPSRIRAAVGDDLISRNSLKKAFVLGDILGQPLSLRKPSKDGVKR